MRKLFLPVDPKGTLLPDMLCCAMPCHIQSSYLSFPSWLATSSLTLNINSIQYLRQVILVTDINSLILLSATSSLLPYLTIHMQSIGLTVEEIAIIYLALPFTTFLSPPITGKFWFGFLIFYFFAIVLSFCGSWNCLLIVRFGEILIYW